MGACEFEGFQQGELTVRHGRLRLRSFAAGLSATVKVAEVRVRHQRASGQTPLACTIRQDGVRLTVELAEAVTIQKGESLQIAIV